MKYVIEELGCLLGAAQSPCGKKVLGFIPVTGPFFVVFACSSVACAGFLLEYLLFEGYVWAKASGS